MKRIITLSVVVSSLIFMPLSATAQSNSPQLQTPQTQATREDLIVVAARALEDRKHKLALRVANNVTDLFPSYATGYLYRAIAFYRLGEVQAAKLDFEKAKRLYTERSKSANLNAEQKNEAQLGLQAIELHLQLLKTRL